MEPSPLRSSAVALRWRPCLDFYEQSVPLLRRLEDANELARFKVGEHEVQADLVSGTRLTVAVDHLDYLSAAGAVVEEEFDRVVGHALSVLTPSDITLVVVLQHLQALDWDLAYEEACRHATRRWMPASAGLGLFDSAILVDGIASVHGTVFQAEFGVIRREDADLRLSRRLGNRVGGPIMPHKVDASGHPRLALFVDSIWRPQEAAPPADELTEWIRLNLRQVVEDAAETVRLLYEASDRELRPHDMEEVDR